MRTESKLALRLELDPRAALVARREIQSFAAGLDEQMRSNLALLVSELVTNSLRHAALDPGGWVQLEATITPDSVRVEVEDPGRRFPTRRDVEAEGGWGLVLVDRMASRWGVARDKQTRVWFESDLPSVRANGQPAQPAWLEVVATWPEPCQRAARAIGSVAGPPQVVAEDRLVWDRYDGCRFVIERSSTAESPPA